jgi:hypothetical protein
MTTALLRGKPHKRPRASKAEIEERLAAIEAIVAEIEPCSVRQVFYQCVVRDIVEKTEAAYEKVQRALVRLRREGRIPYRAIADGTRWQIKPTTFSSLEAALKRTAQTYRRALWEEADAYLEIWLEKDALAGVVHPVTNEFDVPLMVTRGFSSLSFLAQSAEDIEAAEKPAFIFHLGDHDPSGRAAGEHIERTLRDLAPNADIVFERLAVTVEQIAEYALPTRPTKHTDSRAPKFEAEFGAGSVELDAIHPDTLRAIVRDAIEQHVDFDQLEVLKTAEANERQILEMFADRRRRR